MNNLTDGFKETQIGPIPVDWDVKQVNEVSKVILGRTPSTKEARYWDNGTIPFITPVDLRGMPVRWADRAITEEGLEAARSLPEGAVLVSCIGYIGKVGVVDAPVAVTNQQINAIVPYEDQADNWYLAYAMMHLTPFLESRARMTTVPILNKTNFQKIPIPLPPLPEQRRIAHVLRTIQRAIAAQDDLIAATRETKRSLMHRLFTYGPGPDPAPTKETEIGEIPKHWKMIELENVLREKIKNGAFVKRERFGTGAPFLNVADTYDKISVSHHGWERVEATKRELGDYSLQPNDLFFVRSSLKREGIGQCCIVEEVPVPAIYDCHLMRVRVEETQVIPKFLAYYAASPQGKDVLIKRSKTTTMTTINQRGLGGFEFPLPPLSEQQEIARSLEATDVKIAVEQQRKAALQALFQSTLHQLMTGQIRLKENLR